MTERGAKPSRDEGIRIPRRADRAARTSEVVAASIRAQIARGELRPGDRFPTEDDLMDVFGIARTTLREALRILESEGLVTVLRGRNGGPRVTRPTVEHLARMYALLLQLDGVSVEDVFSARQLIEPQLAGALAGNRDDAALAELGTAIDTAEAAVDDGEAFGAAAAAVHEIIARRAGNASLATFARMLDEVLGRFYRTSGRQATAAERRRAVRSYRKLLDLVESGDTAGAEAHWHRQMAYTGKGTRRHALIDLFA